MASVAFDKKRQVWIVRHTDIRGIRRAPTFASKEDAQDRLKEEIAILDSFEGVDISHTFDEAAAEFLAGLNKHGQRTKDKFAGTIKVHLEPIVGGLLLIDIDEYVLDKVQAVLDASESKSAAAIARRLMRRVMHKAEQLAWLPDGYFERNRKVLPALLREPVSRKVERDYLKLSEVKLLLSDSIGLPRMILYLALLAGLRIGEILALLWSDIDAIPGYISVNKTRDEAGKVGKTKTSAGTRYVPISAPLRRALDEWRSKTYRGQNTEIVWKAGIPVARLHNATQWLAKEQSRLGIGDRVPKIRNGYVRIVPVGVFSTHRFRAACAALWLKQGIPVERIAKWLGHSDPRITMEIYAHLFQDGFDWE